MHYIELPAEKHNNIEIGTNKFCVLAATNFPLTKEIIIGIHHMFLRLWSEISLFHKLIDHMIRPFIKPFHKFSNKTHVT